MIGTRCEDFELSESERLDLEWLFLVLSKDSSLPVLASRDARHSYKGS